MIDRLSDAEIVRRLKLVQEHGGERAASRASGLDRECFIHARRLAEKRGLTADTPIMDEAAKLRIEVQRLNADIRALQREADTAEKIRTEIFNIAARTPEPPAWLRSVVRNQGARGTPMTLWSDWHFGEVVRPEEVGGVNEFNADVCAARVKRLVDTTVDLCFNHMGRSSTRYPGIVVGLNGDLITGDIHAELTETNDRTPQQQINDLTDLIASAIEELASKFGHVFVACEPGNHGRGTLKPRMKGRVYCLDAETPILRRDLKWVPAGSLEVGDPIIGFDEHQTHARGRRYQTAEVTHSEIVEADTIKITLRSGQVFWATPEHKFLAHGGKGNTTAKWISAAEMLRQFVGGRKNRGTWKIDRFLDTWAFDTSREAGYLAGVFDGEGTLACGTHKRDGTARAQISITQYNNACLEETKRCLRQLSFDFNEAIVLNRYNKQCHYLTLRGGMAEVVRFLGQVRPQRLLAKWMRFDNAPRSMCRKLADEIVDVSPGGKRKIAMISSSSKTYMSAGYASHNTSHEWVIYTNLERHFRKDKRIVIHVPAETDSYFKVYNHRFLMTHGDSLGVKGGDGIIGAIGPIMRGAIKTGRSEAQIGRDFDTLLLGHWHQMLWLPGIIVNNALKGYDEFARLALRAPYSRPSQALWFVHPEHGITARWEVFLEGRKQAEEQNEWVTFQRRKSA